MIFKRKRKKLEAKNEIVNRAKYSFSQCGEDLIVQYVFNLRGIDFPSYLDIGAHDPFYLSNTALFYEKGCRGINVEANPFLINRFLIHRPEDENLNVGVGPVESSLDFYIMNDASMSTFSKAEADKLTSGGRFSLKEIRNVQVETIKNILKNHGHYTFPDFLSIDVEGMDYEILKSINFESQCPKVICVEAADYSPIGAGLRRSDLIDFLICKGYYEYANTNLNAIMVKNEFWFV